MSELDPGVQVTLEMIGEEVVKRVLSEIHNNLLNHFAIELKCTNILPPYSGSVTPMVSVQVDFISRWTSNRISTQCIHLKVLPDTWGKPYLSL